MKPDIILILIDSCNYRKIISTETITPNIDRLIKNGVTFSTLDAKGFEAKVSSV